MKMGGTHVPSTLSWAQRGGCSASPSVPRAGGRHSGPEGKLLRAGHCPARPHRAGPQARPLALHGPCTWPRLCWEQRGSPGEVGVELLGTPGQGSPRGLWSCSPSCASRGPAPGSSWRGGRGPHPGSPPHAAQRPATSPPGLVPGVGSAPSGLGRREQTRSRSGSRLLRPSVASSAATREPKPAGPRAPACVPSWETQDPVLSGPCG